MLRKTYIIFKKIKTVSKRIKIKKMCLILNNMTEEICYYLQKFSMQTKEACFLIKLHGNFIEIC